jgi:hypothetical protein
MNQIVFPTCETGYEALCFERASLSDILIRSRFFWAAGFFTIGVALGVLIA